jgi:hypothetical protein
MNQREHAMQDLESSHLELVAGGGVLEWLTGLIQSTNGSTDNGGAQPANNASTGIRG